MQVLLLLQLEFPEFSFIIIIILIISVSMSANGMPDIFQLPEGFLYFMPFCGMLRDAD
jgi:hypothetical protein